MRLLDPALMPHGVTWSPPGVMGASLDHAMWFHRPFRADEWLLYDQESPTASLARTLSRGSIFAADGRLVVTVVQEGLLRVSGGRPAAAGHAIRRQRDYSLSSSRHCPVSPQALNS